MDKIELRVEKYADAAVGRHWFAVFGVAGGTIGRGGQNKLVLPDPDAGVARVHAMVRLDSERAYIANLCERRAIRVADADVVSGQEVLLPLGAEVGIGPYVLKAVAFGTPATAAPASASPSAEVDGASPFSAASIAASPAPAFFEATPATQAPAMAPSLAPAVGPTVTPALTPTNTPTIAPAPTPFPAAASTQPPAPTLAPVAAPARTVSPLASTPNPWADIAHTVGGESYVLGTAPVKPVSGGRPPADEPAADNPFAMLGRTGPQTQLPPDVNLMAPPTARPPIPAAPTLAPVSGPQAENVFEGLGSLLPPPRAVTLDRALVIPADFDPFARDTKKEAQAKDPWGGGLQAQSLTEVAHLPNDALIKSLPLGGRIDEPMDNPAHSGLPKRLEPNAEVNPLKLFREPGESVSETMEDQVGNRGSELAQVFNMPREVSSVLPQTAAETQAASARNAPPQALAGAPAQPHPGAASLGLQATQGLDLSLFGDTGSPAALAASLAGPTTPAPTTPGALPLPGADWGAQPHQPNPSPFPAAVAPAAPSRPSPSNIIPDTLDLNLSEPDTASPSVAGQTQPVDLSFDPLAALASQAAPLAAPGVINPAAPAPAASLVTPPLSAFGPAPSPATPPATVQAKAVDTGASIPSNANVGVNPAGNTGFNASTNPGHPGGNIGGNPSSNTKAALPARAPAATAGGAAPQAPKPNPAAPVAGAAPAQRGQAGQQPSSASTPASASDEARALAQAFLEGAGLAPGRVELNVTPEFMRSFGEAFRLAIQGTIDLLAARSEIKREFRAGVTIIASGANNPLKFLPNADGVMMQMVGQNFPGFMKPVPAMNEAYRDLKVHQLALMSGIRAAYSEALTRFDPAELEKRPEVSASLLSKISSTGRKAALWDDYKQSYYAIRRHAEDDLTAFSGQTFLDAYENAAEAAKESL